VNRFAKLLLISIAATFAAFSPARAADLILQPSDPYVEAEIGGVLLKLKVVLDHAPGITLNPDAAARAGLGRGDGIWVEQIGPVKLRGRQAQLRFLVAGVPAEAKVRWHGGPAATDADGHISIDTLPFDSVTLERRRAGPQERDLAFETKLHHNHGVHIRFLAGRRRIAARLSFSRVRTSAPAAAGAALAAVYGGALDPEKSYEEISLGVARPVWPLRLQRPVRLGGLAIPAIMVRASDFRGKHRLERRPDPAEEEIVVRGERRSQDALYRITVGLDVLGRCSAATYVRATGALRLRCAP
jgi:hypothetical protein